MNDHPTHPHDEPSYEDGPPTPHGQEEHRRQYFLPGQMLVHVNHPAGVDPRKLGDLIDQGVQNLGVGEDLVRKVQPQNILTFYPRGDHQGPIFSIAPVELKSTRQEDLMTVLLTIYEQIKNESYPLTEGVSLQAVSPDWLLGSGSHGAHPPSPGSWPVVPAAAVRDWRFSLIGNDPNKSREENTSQLPYAAEAGANVHVAILDTAPSAIDLEEAYGRWHDTDNLITRLLGPTAKLRIIRDIYAEIELLDYSLEGHRYWMADHGLFIAGEIESITPESIKHLIKVFTSYGSASIRTIAQGILRILNDPEIGRPLIVNCSFGLAVPTPGHDDPDFPVEFLEVPGALEHMQTSLRVLFDQLTNQDQVIVVAATGDDTRPGSPRVPARFPAAYDRVIGVGAIPKEPPTGNGSYQAASYSNLADNPSDAGYVTVGGEPGRGRGLLGVYTSELPSFRRRTGDGWPGPGHLPPDPPPLTRDRFGYKRNQKGLVEWAGASFAAPIITGILANWCSQQVSAGVMVTLDDARQALNHLSQTTTTAEGEHVILVTQG